MAQIVSVTLELFQKKDHWLMYTYSEDEEGNMIKGIVPLKVPAELNIDPDVLEEVLNNWAAEKIKAAP